jgi:hypothetical protein
MMSEIHLAAELEHPKERPFPWYCPRCRQKAVRRTSVDYCCQRLYAGQPIEVLIPDLAVPKCAACGELVFDYLAEEQIQSAFGKLVAARMSAPPSRTRSNVREHEVSHRSGSSQVMVKGLKLREMGYCRGARVQITDPSGNPAHEPWIFVVQNREYSTITCTNPEAPGWIQKGVRIRIEVQSPDGDLPATSAT